MGGEKSQSPAGLELGSSLLLLLRDHSQSGGPGSPWHRLSCLPFFPSPSPLPEAVTHWQLLRNIVVAPLLHPPSQPF